MILLMDNFRTYPVPNDMLADNGRVGPWTTFQKITDFSSNVSLLENATWKSDGSSLRALRNAYSSDRHAPQRDFSEFAHTVACAQFVCGSSNETANPPNTEACNFVLFQSPVLDVANVSGSVLNAFYGVSVRSVSSPLGTVDTVGVYYTIVNAATGVTNELLLGRLRPWTRGRHYHVEFKVDHSTPAARIIVYVNGVLEMDRQYDRDRIDSGYQTKAFQRLLLGGGVSAPNNRLPIYSNVVIYTDEADTRFPMGPVDIETVSPTAGQGYDGLRAAPSADDATFITVQPGGSVSGSFVDLSASINPVLAVDAIVRHGAAAGLDPSQITTQIKRADGSVASSVLTATAPGLPPIMRRARLPASFSAADVNGATFTISAAGS